MGYSLPFPHKSRKTAAHTQADAANNHGATTCECDNRKITTSGKGNDLGHQNPFPPVSRQANQDEKGHLPPCCGGETQPCSPRIGCAIRLGSTFYRSQRLEFSGLLQQEGNYLHANPTPLVTSTAQYQASLLWTIWSQDVTAWRGLGGKGGGNRPGVLDFMSRHELPPPKVGLQHDMPAERRQHTASNIKAFHVPRRLEGAPWLLPRRVGRRVVCPGGRPFDCLVLDARHR